VISFYIHLFPSHTREYAIFEALNYTFFSIKANISRKIHQKLYFFSIFSRILLFGTKFFGIFAAIIKRFHLLSDTFLK